MAEDGLYVPVLGQNYVPEGAPEVAEGFVPSHPADDKELNIMRDRLHELGLTDGAIDGVLPLVEEKNFVVSPPNSTKTGSDPVS